jgi:lysosomal acid lipase/cholesteryl ester hydrolase
MKTALLSVLFLASVTWAAPPKSPHSVIFAAAEAKLRLLLEDHMKLHPEQVIQSSTFNIENKAGDNDDTPLMIAKMGYPSETHEVITDDGYILSMHRIPFGKHSPPVDGVVRPAVYLQHGLLCSSADWVMGTPEKSLGYILADAGYDVWLGNYRGNTYSRRHVSLDPDALFDNTFWAFSWDQNGKYDIPAMIDHILKRTGQEKVHYIGHSMGTTAFMVMLNEKPDYKDKVKMANLLAPVAYMENMESPIRIIAPFTDEIEWIMEVLGIGEFLPSSWLMDLLAVLFCGENNPLQVVCTSIIFILCGFNPAQMNETLLPTIMMHTPAGASTKQIIHYGQEVIPANFARYDFGNEDNMQIYGQVDPPHYDIGLVDVPVSLYWSDNDWLAEVGDVKRLAEQLPQLVNSAEGILGYRVADPLWNHLDYTWGIDAPAQVYQELLKNMKAAEDLYQNKSSAISTF